MLNWTRRRLFAATAALAFVIVAAGTASGCVGARPLAMGGAFTGLADDANATYWNPAGLVQLKSPTGTLMHTTTNRDVINYQDFLAYAAPISSFGAFGFSWIKDNLAIIDSERLLIDSENWYWGSLAYRINSKTSIGVNLKQISNSQPGWKTDFGIDFGVLHKIDAKWTVGLLIQDANKPVISGPDGDKVIWTRNWRPGFSFRPDGKSVATAEVYEALDSSRSLRLGYEKKLNDKLALRAGYYGLGDTDNQSFTFGCGLANLGGKSSGYPVALDVAAMVGDIDTVFTSLTTQF